MSVTIQPSPWADVIRFEIKHSQIPVPNDLIVSEVERVTYMHVETVILDLLTWTYL